jgi:hypothetical protein
MKEDRLAYVILILVSFITWYFLLKIVFLEPTLNSYDYLILIESAVAVIVTYIVSRQE